MIELLADVVRKRGNPEEIAFEAAKTRAAVAVAARTPDLLVPEVLRHDAEAGVLETRRVQGFVSVNTLAAARDARTAAVCRRAGAALGAMHASLTLPEGYTRPLPASIVGDPADAVIVHGDFNGSNVGYDTATDRIVVIDWSAAPALGGIVSRGSRYFDLLWFTLFFFRFRPLRSLRGWTPEAWADAFLAGYAASGAPYDPRRYATYADAIEGFLARERTDELARQAGTPRRIAFALWRNAGWRRWMRYRATLARGAAA